MVTCSLIFDLSGTYLIKTSSHYLNLINNVKVFSYYYINNTNFY